MARAKPASKRNSRRTLPLLGAAGASLAMVGGSSAAASTADVTPPRNDPHSLIILDEEEISDVSLGTFHVFDREHDIRLTDEKVAARCGGCRGCRGCAVARCGRCGGCAIARCRCGCGVGIVGCARCGCSCGGGCTRWNGWAWVNVCW